MSRFLRVCEGPCSIALVALFIAIVFGLSIASRSVLLGDLDRVAATRAAQAGLSAAVAARLDARAARDPQVRAVLARAAALRVEQGASDAAARRNIDRILAVELVLGAVGVALMFAAVRLRLTIRRQDAQIATMRRVTELRSIADLVDDLLWTAGPGGRVDYISQRWLARSGLARSDVLAGGWERAVHPDDLAVTERDWRKAVESGEGFDVEHRLRDASGGYRWFRSRAIPFRDPRGAIAGWFGISTDVDATRRRLETLERASAGERRLVEHLRAALAAPPLPEVPFIAFDAARVGRDGEGGISGQWYEAVLLPDDRIFVCLGRGVGESGTEALDAIDLARRAIAGAAAEETCPRAVLARANTVVLLRRGSAIAALCGYFDPARQCFTYASAGHDAPFLADGKGTRMLGAGGLPLGVLVGAEFAKHDVSIANALLVLVGISAGAETRAGGAGSDAALLDAIGNAVSAASPAAAIGDAMRARANGAEAVVVTARGVAGGLTGAKASA